MLEDGGEMYFTPNALNIKSERKIDNYHNDMNFENYGKWIN